MLKKIFHLTDRGVKALHKASLWMTLFELACSCSVIPIAYALYEMIQVYTGKLHETTGIYIYYCINRNSYTLFSSL